MNKEDFLQRTRAFGLRVIRLVERLTRNQTAQILGRQLLRSGTSVGANYRAACRARSRAEFASRIGVVAEEADESLYWLELMGEGNSVPKEILSPLLNKADELTAIFTSGRRSASRPHQTSTIKHQTSTS